MELAAQEGRHPASMTQEERLRSIVASFHESPGLNQKNFLDEEKIRSINNLIVGSCEDPKLKPFHLI